MMHRCSSSNMVGGCTCGMYHTQSCNSFPMVFSMNNGYRGYDEGGEMYSFSNSPSSSVDCTLSLGTPSTRLTSDDGNNGEKKRSSRMSAFGWNILPSKQTPAPPSSSKSHRGGSSGNSGGDPLLARRCANCDTTSTPLWRNGPRGPKSLCNACGIRYKKEERRATAAAANSNGGGGGGGGGYGAMEAQQMMDNNTWAAAQPQKTPYYYGNEYQFLQEDNHLNSWRFNVTDRPSFVHDFTR